MFAQSDWSSASYSGKVLVYNTSNGFMGYAVPEYEYEPGGGGTAISFTTMPVTSAVNGTPTPAYSYTAMVNVTGAAFSLVAGPSWLSVNASTGVVSGTPDAVGNATVTIRATLNGTTADQTYTLTVSEAASAASMNIVNVFVPMLIMFIMLMFVLRMIRRTGDSI